MSLQDELKAERARLEVSIGAIDSLLATLGTVVKSKGKSKGSKKGRTQRTTEQKRKIVEDVLKQQKAGKSLTEASKKRGIALPQFYQFVKQLKKADKKPKTKKAKSKPEQAAA